MKIIDSKLVRSFREKYLYKDGVLVWLNPCARNVKKGDLVGYERKDGYRLTWIDNKVWLVHQIIFVMCHGYLPVVVDHINRNTRDNRIENLRDATRSLNGLNTSNKGRGTSGRKGVSWNTKRQKWQAYIKLDYRKICLGYFLNKKDAIAAREAKERQLNCS